ncbi:MAG: hypothetical protein IIU11_07395, partial [Bacteroidales bacterium]|nr:hypothetical protein [Bacteroidales bacterium]
KDKNTEALYQHICQTCGDRVVIGTGESSMGGYSKKFYMMTAKSINELNVRELTTAPDDFEPRANAASFYLNYTKNGDVYDRLYVGTGRTGSEGSEDLLGDLWCFDFSTSEWIRCSDCSNLLREGAIGFSVTRNDDRFSNDLEENARGIFSFGRGRTETEAVSKALNDTWEYLP